MSINIAETLCNEESLFAFLFICLFVVVVVVVVGGRGSQQAVTLSQDPRKRYTTAVLRNQSVLAEYFFVEHSLSCLKEVTSVRERKKVPKT